MNWQPIATAPKDGTEVLLWTPEGVDVGEWTEQWGPCPDDPGNDGGWIGAKHAQPGCTGVRRESHYWREAVAQPTHWMPIPEAPWQADPDCSCDVGTICVRCPIHNPSGTWAVQP